jgi:hypothetical protein
MTQVLRIAQLNHKFRIGDVVFKREDGTYSTMQAFTGGSCNLTVGIVNGIPDLDHFDFLNVGEAIEQERVEQEIAAKVKQMMDDKVNKILSECYLPTATSGTASVSSLTMNDVISGKRKIKLLPMSASNMTHTYTIYDDPMYDPICDCGKPGWACCCAEEDKMERDRKNKLDGMESGVSKTRKLDL